MINLKIMNADLKERYKLIRNNVDQLVDVVVDEKPSIITMQNVSEHNQKYLKSALNNYKFFNDGNQNTQNIILVEKSYPITYDKKINLDKKIEEQLSTDYKEKKDSNCQVIVISLDHKFITFINANINHRLEESKNFMELKNLQKILEAHQDKYSLFHTNAQVVTGDFNSSFNLDELISIYNMEPIEKDYQLLISDSVELTDLKPKVLKKNSLLMANLYIK